MTILFVLLFTTTLYGSNVGYASISNSTYKGIENMPIKHVILIFQGKHSFDGLFGTYPNADGLRPGIKMPSNPLAANMSEYIEPFHIETVTRYNPEDDQEAYSEAYNDGTMNGFVYAQRKTSDGGRTIMGYLDHRDIPYYWKFASEYVLAQRFFSSSMSSGLVNGLHAIGADPTDYGKQVPQNGSDIGGTIFDDLEKNMIPWKIYIEDYDQIDNWSNTERERSVTDIPILSINRFTKNESLASNIEDLKNFYSDIRDNKVPAVTYIYLTKSKVENLNKAIESQELATSLVYSLMKSNYWKESAVIITFNESGGWYDHVKPPRDDDGQKGFRVPAIFISPYAKKGYIDNQIYDIRSVVNFIETSFGITPVVGRDNNVSDMSHSFDFTKPPREAIYLDGILKSSGLTKTDNVYGVNLVYLFSILGPILVTIIWYCKKQWINNKSISRE